MNLESIASHQPRLFQNISPFSTHHINSIFTTLAHLEGFNFCSTGNGNYSEEGEKTEIVMGDKRPIDHKTCITITRANGKQGTIMTNTQANSQNINCVHE
jgi:hypothetical protein